MDQDWVALNTLVLEGLQDGYTFEDPPRTAEDLDWLAATITDHVIGGVMPRPEMVMTRRRWFPLRRR